MSSQIRLFVILALLLIKTWIVFYAFYTWKSFRKPYLKWFFIYGLTGVFFAAHVYVWRYISLNIIPEIIENLDPRSENINDLVFSLVALLAMTALIRLILGIAGRGFNRRARLLLYAGAGVIAVGYAARTLAPWGMQVFGWFDTVATYVTVRVSSFEFIPAGLALFLARRQNDEKTAFLLRGFGWVFLAGSAIRWTPYTLHHLGLTGVAMSIVYYAASLVSYTAPYVWLRYVFVPHVPRERLPLADAGVFAAVADKYNISNRESEVIQLIMDGKSNKEIQDSLVVSIHTVKNHIYNIYRKLGVNSRYSLIHFITQFRDQG